jgi:hypothetical protein
VVIGGSAIMFGYRAMEDTMLIDAFDPAVAEEVDQWSGQQAAAWGFLPNYVAAFASRPDVARAWTKLNLTIRDGMDRRPFRTRHDRSGAGAAVDLLHRGTFEVPA